VFGLLFTGNKSSFDVTRNNLSLECWHACLVMSPLGLLLIKLLINMQFWRPCFQNTMVYWGLFWEG